MVAKSTAAKPAKSGKAPRKGRAAVAGLATQLERLVVEYVSVGSIRNNQYNPNKQDPHDFDLLCKSIRSDGFTQPVIVQRKTMEIVDGEHRWRAAQKLGYIEIPVVFVDMSAEQMRVATLRHNRARGHEDLELSAQVLRDLEKLGAIEYAQKELQLDNTELERLLRDVPAPEALAAGAFSDAWDPTKAGASAGRGDPESSSTPAAATSLREAQAGIDTAKTAEERASRERELGDIYRLTLVFARSEAAEVRAALEPNPAVKVLAMCRAQAALGR